jgi:hypothetical protein
MAHSNLANLLQNHRNDLVGAEAECHIAVACDAGWAIAYCTLHVG